MWQYIQMSGSVGAGAKNNPDDVMQVQARILKWIGMGHLPNVELIPVDGACGPKTRRAIGAFQKKIMGFNNPDCRVDPGGKTLQALYQNIPIQLTPADKAYLLWLQQYNGLPTKTKPDIDWDVPEADLEAIRKDWGSAVADWVALPPPYVVDAKEFLPPPSKRDKYEAVFVWKSSKTHRCAHYPYDKIQIIATVRSDRGFWSRYHPDPAGLEAIVASTSAATRDLRLYVVGHKMSPPTARAALLKYDRDTIYQMFLGMFQLMAPQGTGGKWADHGAAFAGGAKAIISYTQEKDKNKNPWYKHF